MTAATDPPAGADLLLVNANVLTMGPARPRDRSVAVAGGRIGAMKLSSDGSLIGRAAAMTGDYADTPGNRGHLQAGHGVVCGPSACDGRVSPGSPVAGERDAMSEHQGPF